MSLEENGGEGGDGIWKNILIRAREAKKIGHADGGVGPTNLD